MRLEAAAAITNRVEGTEAEITNTSFDVIEELVAMFDQLFLKIPQDEQYTPKVIMEGLVHFLITYSGHRGLQEQEVLLALQQLELSLSLSSTIPINLSLAIQYVRSELEQFSTQATSIPEEGKLHISSLHDGGQSGRPYTFIVGMDEQNWSISAKQDPILLDDERLNISENLPVSSEASRWLMAERMSRLGMIRGGCTVRLLTILQRIKRRIRLMKCFSYSAGRRCGLRRIMALSFNICPNL